MAEECWICGKGKGQPPQRCPGHYQVATAPYSETEAARLEPRAGDRWERHADMSARVVCRADACDVYYWGRDWKRFRCSRATWNRYTRNATLVKRGPA